MNKSLYVYVVGLMVACSTSVAFAQVRGSGSTFAQDLYEAWGGIAANKARGGVQYTASGSSAGVQAASTSTADFGASEIPLSRERLQQAKLYQVPTALGGVVLVTNLGVGRDSDLIFNGEVLSGIFRGKIRKWNAPEITALNPTVSLPDIEIRPVIRKAGSGTTYVFSSYLTKASPAWSRDVGPTNAIKLDGAFVVDTNAAVAAAVKGESGAIGYVEYSFATAAGLPVARLVNKWGDRVRATPESLRSAVGAVKWELIRADDEPTFELDVTDAGCPRCWPITGVTYALVPRSGRAFTRTIDFLRTGLSEGRDVSERIGYVALPSRAEGIVRSVMLRWTRGRASGAEPAGSIG